MKRVILAATFSCFFFAAVSLAQTDEGSYAGREARDIKALSEDEIEGYLNGAGMGLAKAAELNSYPGPKHVLEMAEKLALTDDQKKLTRGIFDSMAARAKELGNLIVERERFLDGLFKLGEIDEEKLTDVVGEIARLEGKLRAVHLAAHLEMKNVLSGEQVEKYCVLRGYASGSNNHSHKQHRHDH